MYVNFRLSIKKTQKKKIDFSKFTQLYYKQKNKMSNKKQINYLKFQKSNDIDLENIDFYNIKFDIEDAIKMNIIKKSFIHILNYINCQIRIIEEKEFYKIYIKYDNDTFIFNNLKNKSKSFEKLLENVVKNIDKMTSNEVKFLSSKEVQKLLVYYPYIYPNLNIDALI